VLAVLAVLAAMVQSAETRTETLVCMTPFTEQAARKAEVGRS